MNPTKKITLPADPFAVIHTPLAELIDPASTAISSVRTLKQVERLDQLVKNVYRSLKPCWCWGNQYVRKSDGESDWQSESVSVLKSAFDPRPKEQRREPLRAWGMPLGQWQLAKHYLGRGITVGTGDRPSQAWYKPSGVNLASRVVPRGMVKSTSTAYWSALDECFLEDHEVDPALSDWEVIFGPAPRRVSAIRIDVDNDKAWLLEDYEALQTQLSRERRIANEAGLNLRVFRTGGRGTQAVLELPAPIPIAAGEWISKAIQKAYRARLNTVAHDFSTAFDKPLRLPGGMHLGRSRFGLGLWLDPDSSEILPLAEQLASMPIRARSASCSDDFSKQMMEFAALISDDEVFSNCSFDEAARRGAHLPFVDRLCCLVGSDPVIISCSPTAITTASGNSSVLWAEALWDAGFESGGFYDFVRSGAIRAAIILFGDDAKSALIEKAKSVSARPGQLQKRLRLIDDFLGSHRFLPPSCATTNDLSDSAKLVLLMLRRELRSACKRQDAFIRNASALECAICLLDMREFGEIEMSGTYLCDWIKRSQNNTPSVRSCLRAIRSLTEGDPSCCLPVLSVTSKGKRAGKINVATRFAPTEFVLSLLKLGDVTIDNIGDTSN